MPDLDHALFNQDLGHLKIIAENWGLEIAAPDARSTIEQLIKQLVNAENFKEMWSALPETAQQALIEIAGNQARLLWGTFIRRFGDVREMGIAKRDREKPHKDTQAVTAELLWYRGLIGRSFFDTPEGLLEFAYIPDDLLPMIPKNSIVDTAVPAVRLALREEQEITSLAADLILDDACTLLAGLRNGMTVEQLEPWMICARKTAVPLRVDVLRVLLQSAGLITSNGSFEPEPIRKFLETERAELLPWLFNIWLLSRELNEVRMLPGLQAEGEWVNDPQNARQKILNFLISLMHASAQDNVKNERPYWSLNSLLSWIRDKNPDFQRSAGDFDSWYLFDTRAERYFRGIEDWDQVDGALIRFIISGPLHWLGFLDLGYVNKSPTDRPILSAFRFSNIAEKLVSRQPLSYSKSENESLIIKSDGRISARRMTPRSLRYQVARFCEWDHADSDNYHYVITPKSLKGAQKQGLTIQHMLAILGKAAKTIPPSLIQALKRWDSAGSEAYFEQVVVLRVKNPEIIQKLRASRAARFLGDPLGPAAIIVRPGSWKIVSQAIAEMGLLSETEFDTLTDLTAAKKRPG